MSGDSRYWLPGQGKDSYSGSAIPTTDLWESAGSHGGSANNSMASCCTKPKEAGSAGEPASDLGGAEGFEPLTPSMRTSGNLVNGGHLRS